jgi:hypothetical protein
MYGMQTPLLTRNIQTTQQLPFVADVEIVNGTVIVRLIDELRVVLSDQLTEIKIPEKDFSIGEVITQYAIIVEHLQQQASRASQLLKSVRTY